MHQQYANSLGPLQGLRVLELEAIGPVPLAGTILADLGADVVKIVRPGWFAKQQPLNATQRGRRIIELDLKNAHDRDRLLALVAEGDILIEGFRPGVLENLGLGSDVLLERNPRMIIGRMTGWGQTGERSQQAGHDINYLSLTGHLAAITDPKGRPTVPLNLIADFGGGTMFLLVGILAALNERQNSGHGQVVDAAMVDGSSMLGQLIWALRGAERWVDEPRENLLDGGMPWYDVYPTKDGRYMAVGALEPAFYTELLEGLGITQSAPDRSDPAAWPQLRALFTERFMSGTLEHWTKVFQGSDACVTPVLKYHEAPHDTHMQSRGTFLELDGVTQPAPAPRFSRTRVSTPAGVPIELTKLDRTTQSATGTVWPSRTNRHTS